MLDSYQNQTVQKPKQFPMLEMTTYINELFSINHHKIVDQGQTISQLKKIVDAQCQTIIELKSKVAKLVGPLQAACPPPAQQRLQTPPQIPPPAPAPATSKGKSVVSVPVKKSTGNGKVWGQRAGIKANMVKPNPMGVGPKKALRPE